MADVVLDAITKIYGDGTRAVRDLSLDIQDGEFLVLVGPSGCGKTTALRMVAGLEDISSGELRIGGRVVNNLPSRDRDVAMVFQSYALYPHLNVADNIGFGLKLRKVPKDEINRRVAQAAQVLGLDELLDRKPRALSGGQRQRVAMGRAIVREPQAFLMDEPLSNLDAKLRVQMRAEIARIQRDLGVTTIYVTHDQTEAMTLGDRVAVMKRGVLQQVDAPQVLYDRPTNLFVAGFIGSPAMNIVRGVFTDRGDNGVTLTLGSQELQVSPKLLAERPGIRRFFDQTVGVGIRPEDMEDASIAGAPATSCLQAKVELVEAMGSDLLVHFGLDAAEVLTEDKRELVAETGADAGTDGGTTTVIARFSPRSEVTEGAAVKVAVDTERLHVFALETELSLWD